MIVPTVAAGPSRAATRRAAGRSDGVRDLWLIDVAGRRVAVLPGGMRLVQGAGSTTRDLAASGTRFAPGVYLVALVDRQGAIEAATRVVVLD